MAAVLFGRVLFDIRGIVDGAVPLRREKIELL